MKLLSNKPVQQVEPIKPHLHKCPHHNCERKLPAQLYACRGHWFALPKKLRDDIWKGYTNNSTLWNESDRKARIYWRDRNIK